MASPLLIGLDLSTREEQFLEAMLSLRTDFRRIDGAPLPGQLMSGLNFLSGIDERQIEQLVSWNFPLLFVAGQNFSPERELEFFRRAQAALWHLPLPGDPILLPPLDLPKTRGLVYGVTEDADFRTAARRIFQFSGYDLRSDFRSATELIHLLASDPPGREGIQPEILLIDLDSTNVDAGIFFYELGKLFKNNTSLKKTLQIMALKDFRKPGTDIRALSETLRPFVRRIYDYEGSLAAIIESCIFHTEYNERTVDKTSEPSPSSDQKSGHIFRYRSLHEILNASQGEMRAPAPGRRLDELAKSMKPLAAGLIFSRYYEYLIQGHQQNVLLSKTSIIASPS